MKLIVNFLNQFVLNVIPCQDKLRGQEGLMLLIHLYLYPAMLYLHLL